MADEIKIDKGVPMPPRVRAAFAANFPWKKMDVGDSFFVVFPPAARGAVVAYAKRQGLEISVRKATQNGVHGFRIWRIA